MRRFARSRWTALVLGLVWVSTGCDATNPLNEESAPSPVSGNRPPVFDLVPASLTTASTDLATTSAAVSIVHQLGDADNFGFTSGFACIFYNFAEPEDLGIFDLELTSGDEVQSWTHDFRTNPNWTPAFQTTSVTIEVPERFSDSEASTITIDGATQDFTIGGFASCGARTQVFTFTGAAAAFANDGLINITFRENGDHIALDYARVTVVGEPFINKPPVVNAFPAVSGNEGSPVTFTVDATDPDGDALTYVWTFGDATPAQTTNVPTVQHTYANNAPNPAVPYTVTVRVTDTKNNENVATTTAAIANVSPTVTVVPPDQTVQAGQVATLMISFTDPGNESGWFFTVNWGDGTCLPVANCGPGHAVAPGKGIEFPVSHAYTVPGEYTVTIMVREASEPLGGVTTQVKITATNRPPTNVNSGAPYTGVEGTAINFTGSATDPDGDALTFHWNFGDGETATGATASHTYADNGPFSAILTVRDARGGETIRPFVVSVSNANPSATFGNNGPVNEGTAFTLSLAGATDPGTADIPTLQFAYDCGTGVFQPGGPSFNCPTTDNGTKRVRGRVLDKNGGAAIYEADVTVNNVAPTVSAPATRTIPSMVPLNFTGSFTDPGADAPWATDIAWGGPEGSTPGSVNVRGLVSGTHTYNRPGNYTITLKVTDKDGASGVATTLVTVLNRRPHAVIKPVPATIECTGVSTQVTLDGSTSFDEDGTVTSYAWSEGGSPRGSTAVVTVPCIRGSHTLTLAVTDDSGDTGSASVTFEIVDTKGPSVAIAGPAVDLWSANHKYELIRVLATMSDLCTPTTSLVVSGYVESNEADDENGAGDGNTTGDIKVTKADGSELLSSNAQPRVAFNPFTDKLEVRSERQGNNAPRHYTLVLTVRDAAGNETTVRQIVATVQHDQGR